MTLTCVFTSGVTVVTINGTDDANDVSLVPQWSTQITQGLARTSYRRAARLVSQWSLRFSSLTLAQKNALASFFLTTVQGPTTAFSYTHTDGVTRTVRFTQGSIDWSRASSAEWGTTLQLEENPVA